MNINLVAPINSLSYGQVSRAFLKAFDLAGHKIALWPLGNVDPNDLDQDEHPLIQRSIENTKLFDCAAPCIRIWHQFDMAMRAGNGKFVGYTIFEVDRLNEVEKNHLRSCDLVCVPSSWAQGIVNSETGSPRPRVVTIPLAVDTTVFHPDVKPARPNCKPNTTVFLNVGKWEKRKGHDVLPQVFRKAFSPNDDVMLVMHADNPFLRSEETAEWEAYYRKILGSQVTFSRRVPNQRLLATIMAGADCGIFPSRAEGWNMPLAEMMAMGKQVIATNYSAHTEFCDNQNCHLVEPGHQVPAYDAKWFDGSAQWADIGESQVEQMVHYLRVIRDDKQHGLVPQNTDGIRRFRETFTWAKSAQMLIGAIG